MSYLMAIRTAYLAFDYLECKTCGEMFKTYDYRWRYCHRCRALREMGNQLVTDTERYAPKAVTHHSGMFGAPCQVCGRQHWGIWRICQQCGSGYRPQRIGEGGWPYRFVRGRSDTVYCSNGCRQKAYRARKKAQ